MSVVGGLHQQEKLARAIGNGRFFVDDIHDIDSRNRRGIIADDFETNHLFAGLPECDNRE